MADMPNRDYHIIPKVGDRVRVKFLNGVYWPGGEDDIPIFGTITSVDFVHEQIQFLPDEPDESSNGDSNAREFDENGWFLEPDDEWTLDEYQIEEEPWA